VADLERFDVVRGMTSRDWRARENEPAVCPARRLGVSDGRGWRGFTGETSRPRFLFDFGLFQGLAGRKIFLPSLAAGTVNSLAGAATRLPGGRSNGLLPGRYITILLW
jgi:hypothetical protein